MHLESCVEAIIYHHLRRNRNVFHREDAKTRKEVGSTVPIRIPKFEAVTYTNAEIVLLRICFTGLSDDRS